MVNSFAYNLVVTTVMFACDLFLAKGFCGAYAPILPLPFNERRLSAGRDSHVFQWICDWVLSFSLANSLRTIA